VIGADNANTFDKWVNYQDLERMIRFIVIPRTGIPFNPKSMWYTKSPHMLLIPETPLPQISSTDIRQELQFTATMLTGYPERMNCLNEKVLNYIKENNLYKD
jgi:nicotinic acid mononucleotide adenylyltransferase